MTFPLKMIFDLCLSGLELLSHAESGHVVHACSFDEH
jgi:hypothetical protein